MPPLNNKVKPYVSRRHVFKSVIDGVMRAPLIHIVLMIYQHQTSLGISRDLTRIAC